MKQPEIQFVRLLPNIILTGICRGDLVLSYDKKVKDHNIGVVAGASYTHDYSYRLSASGSGSSIDLIPTLNATADSTQRASSTKTMEATLSYFGRVNYDYNGKISFLY